MYKFECPSRIGTGSYKWDLVKDVLPMWVADMDFETAPEIKQALIKRAEHGVFGYALLPDEWYNAYISWWKTRHSFEIKKEWLMFSTGVVASISSLVRKLTTPNENVLIMPPVYNIFFNSIINNGCRVLESPLVYKNGSYEIDFTDLEAKLGDPQTTLMILCNPHNPVGKIWDKSTLAKIGALCKKYGVTVLSDEIHCDVVRPSLEYVPFASVDETCKNISVTLISPTKTFNIAGLQTSAIFVPEPFLRHKVWRAINTDEIAEPNVFAVVAAVTAFEKGAVWLDELREILWDNRAYAEHFIDTEIPALSYVKGDATYLMWIDIKKLNVGSLEFKDYLLKNAKLYLCEGIEYGTAGEGFLRLNLATSKANVQEGMRRLKQGVETYKHVH